MTTAARAGTGQLSTTVKRQTACMMKVLKTEPRVLSSELLVSTSDGWNQPVVKYEYSDDREGPTTVTIVARKERPGDESAIYFEGRFSGLFSGSGGPNTYGSGQIMEDWRNKCGMRSWVVF